MWPAPADLKVSHFDWNNIGIKLLNKLTICQLIPEQELPMAGGEEVKAVCKPFLSVNIQIGGKS